MGAQAKLAKQGRLISFDFGAPEFHISAGDRLALRRNPDWSPQNPDEHVDDSMVVIRAVRLLVDATVASAFPSGIDRASGRIWAAWQESIEDDAPAVVEMPVLQVEWLRKRIADEDLKVRTGLAGWREALIEYIDGLMAEPVTPSPGVESAAQ